LSKSSMTGRHRQPGCACYAKKFSAADGAHAFYFKAIRAGLVTINIACSRASALTRRSISAWP
jgi:hypothetical protein